MSPWRTHRRRARVRRYALDEEHSTRGWGMRIAMAVNGAPLEGDLCRGTDYHNIVQAVLAAAGAEGGAR